MTKTNTNIVYLACPYSHPHYAIRLARFHSANIAAGRLMNEGYNVYSPISHTHPIAEVCDLPTDWTFWEPYDRAFLQISSALYVLQIDGWDISKGVSAEIVIAGELGIEVVYLEADFIK